MSTEGQRFVLAIWIGCCAMIGAWIDWKLGIGVLGTMLALVVLDGKDTRGGAAA